MAIVIADTSPLQYLFQVGHLELLQALFETVLIAEAVRDELLVGRRLGFEVPDPAAYSWISIRAAVRAPALERFELGPGELAALSLAPKLPGDLVLLDDAEARAAASGSCSSLSSERSCVGRRIARAVALACQAE